MSKITVIVPVYKVEKYLQRCVDSILAQTYSDFELVLVDDGTPDCSGEMCDEYLLQDERIITIHQINGGLSAARNSGIDWSFACSSSEWLTFVDSDDWVHYQFLEFFLTQSIKNNVMLSTCKLNWTKELKNTMTSLYDIQECKEVVDVDLAYVKGFEIMVACGKLYKKELFKNVRFPIGKFCEDRFTTYKLICQCPQILLLDFEMYYYYQSPNSIMRSKWSPKKLDDFCAMEEQLGYFKAHNYPHAYNCVLSDYIKRLYWQIIEIKESDRQYIKYGQILRKELRKRLFLYGKRLGYQINTHTEIYYEAFRYYTKLYLKIRRLKELLKG